MISERVTSEEELYAHLRSTGFEPTDETTATGTLWKHVVTGCHLLVPFSVQGYYPRWLTGDMFDQVRRIAGKH